MTDARRMDGQRMAERKMDAPDLTEKIITIDERYVDDKLGPLIQDQDLSRYIL